MFSSTSCGQARPPCCCSASFDLMEQMERLCCSTALQPGRGPEPFSLPSNCLPRSGSPSLRGDPHASGQIQFQFTTIAADGTMLCVLTRSRRTCRRTPVILPGLHVEEVSCYTMGRRISARFWMQRHSKIQIWCLDFMSTLDLMTSSLQLLVSRCSVGQGSNQGHLLSRRRSQSWGKKV